MASATQDHPDHRTGRLERALLRQRDRHHDQALRDRRHRELLEEALRQQHARAEAEAAEASRLRGELDAVYRSTSWRVTAPLRWLRRSMG